ncbi:MAG: hypothetical protein HQM12_20785, partial [SAR324 cluster bacterium]|nr:hypothetical protein [SAR324 cluster bacterium]
MKNIMLALSCFLLCGTVLWAAPNREDVKKLLEGYEWQIDPVQFGELGADTDLVLMEIITDPAPMLNYYRFRALEALRLFPNDRVATFLEKYLGNESDTSRVYRAFDSYTRNFSKSRPQTVQKIAEKLLVNSKPDLRIAAVEALKKIKSADALKLVEKQLE